jgi:hypothetical protein
MSLLGRSARGILGAVTKRKVDFELCIDLRGTVFYIRKKRGINKMKLKEMGKQKGE